MIRCLYLALEYVFWGGSYGCHMYAKDLNQPIDSCRLRDDQVMSIRQHFDFVLNYWMQIRIFICQKTQQVQARHLGNAQGHLENVCWRGFARTLKQHLNFEEPRLQQKCGGELFGVRCRFCYRFGMTFLESDFLSTRTDYCEAERKWIVGLAAPVLVAQTICGFSGWGLDSFRSEGCCHSIFQISEVGLGHLRLLSIQSFGILKWV